MNLSHSLPNRSNAVNLRLLAAVIALAFIALAIIQISNAFQVTSGDSTPIQPVSAATLSAAPQVVPVPTPSQSNWRHMALQMSATPTPAVFQPTAQPVATPPAGK